MEKYILISVSERDIEVSYWNSYEEAHKKMVEELEETGNRDNYDEDGDYEINEWSAWSNMNNHCNCDWLIEKLPIKTGG